MNKIIIPRRDHEVYFIPLPEDIKANQIQAFAADQLNRLHPAFSAASVFDLQHFAFKKRRWIMATVMDAETLAEYKILNKGAAFYTNTSIAVRKKEFLHTGIKTIDDESIGFDAEKNSPVSVPIEQEKDSTHQEFVSRLKGIPPRHGVFVKKTPRYCIALASSAVVLLMLTSFILVFTSKSAMQIQPLILYTEAAAEKKHLPFATEILERFSSDIVEAGGEILRWQYNEDTEPFMTIQLRRMDILTAQQILLKHEYVFLQDIRNVSYTGGIPYITVNVNMIKAEYIILAAALFPAQNSSLPMLSELTNAFQQNKIPLVSETLPTSSNAFYTITYTADDRELLRSLEIISNICGKYPLRVKNMDISISGDKHRFTVICGLAYCDTAGAFEVRAGQDKNKIPQAFGYRTPAPPAAARQIFIVHEITSEPSVIGSIREGGMQMVFYRNTAGGKIRAREGNE
jgi:hypothetical protein